METKFDKVKDFFEKPDYLSNKVNIEIRRTIIKEFFPSIQGTRILDIGCGDGSLSLQYSSHNEVVLLDGAKQMIDAAKENARAMGTEKNVTFVQGDMFKFEDNDKFDLILCIGVISHIDDVSKMLDWINSHLRPDGKAIIQFSDIDHFRYQKRKSSVNSDTYGYKLNTFNQPSFYRVTKNAGLVFKYKKGYPWQFRGMDRLSSANQLAILNFLRKSKLTQFLNSEWLVLFEKGKLLHQ